MAVVDKPLTKVLLVGRRNGIVKALEHYCIPYKIWHHKINGSHSAGSSPDRMASKHLISEDKYWRSKRRVKKVIDQQFDGEVFSHVIAGSESSVITAAICRRLLDCRRYEMTTIWRCRDKLLMKQFLSRQQIPMTEFRSMSHSPERAELEHNLGSPFVIKARKESGGREMCLSDTINNWPPHHSRELMAEALIQGDEASVESFIDDGRIKFTNITRYQIKKHCNFVPAAFEKKLEQEILELNQKVIAALKLKWGMTHLEVYIRKKTSSDNRRVLFGEVAIRPPGGYIMNAIEQAWAFDPWQAYVAMETGLYFSFPPRPERFAASEIFHPGSGVVKSVSGEEVIKNSPMVSKFKIKVSKGDSVYERTGVGKDVGFCIYRCESARERLALHKKIRKSLNIRMQPKAKE